MDANKRGVREQRWRSGATLPFTFLRKPTEHNTSVIQVSRLLKKPKASRVLTRQIQNGWWRAGALTPEQRIELCILIYLTLSLMDCTLPFIQEGDDSSSRSTNIFLLQNEAKLNDPWFLHDQCICGTNRSSNMFPWWDKTRHVGMIQHRTLVLGLHWYQMLCFVH